MTRRSSLRAAAREIYAALVEGEGAGASKPETPTHDPPSLSAGAASLTARVRALYEDSSVPVAKIARLAGITERTIYRYVIKQNWKRRYACAARDDAVARANRGRRWQRTDGFAPAILLVRGAGGRFIRRDDIGKPFAHGLKATDPAGAARAQAACDAASRLAGVAQARALQRAHTEARLRAIDAANHALADYARFRQETAKESAEANAKERAKERAKARAKESGKERVQPPAAARGGEPLNDPFKEPSKEPSKEPPKERPKARVTKRRPPPLHGMIERSHLSIVEPALRHWHALQARHEADRAARPEPGAH